MELIVDFPQRQDSPRSGLQELFEPFKKASHEYRNDLWYTKRELSKTTELIIDFSRRQDSPRSRLQVLFADKSQLMFFTKASHEHRNDLWYTQCELQSFRFEAKKLMLETAGEADDIQGPTGCENHLKSPPEVFGHRQIHKRVVLSEQRCQFLAGVRDPDALAQISEASSEWCVTIARTAALVHHVSCLSRDLQLKARNYSCTQL